MKKIFLYAAIVCLVPLTMDAHIGSPGVTFEGKAGDYPVMVLINPPDVIPGTATVDIFTDGRDINTIWAKPVFWFAGGGGTPQADEMKPVPGEPGHYRGLIWLMDAGTWAIEIEVKGNAKSGMVIVPVMAISTSQKKMDASLGWTLFALGVLLVVLMVTIISVSVSDSLVRPDGVAGGDLRRKRLWGAAISAVVIISLLYGGKSWWSGLANDYQRYMYRPFKANTTMVRKGDGYVLNFSLDTARLTNLTFTRNLSYIIPDHGKLMHMFMVRSGSMDVFAHLHPKRKDSLTFVAPMPRLPEGKYLVFADVTRMSGFSETIPDTFDVSPSGNNVAFASLDSIALDPDDTYFFTNPITPEATAKVPEDNVIICGKPGIRLPLADGSTITWEHSPVTPLISNTLYSLKFNLQDENGKPALLEPYLGMAGHAVIMKADGSVFIHLHPVGSYSMASQQALLTRVESATGPINLDRMPRSTAFMDSIDHTVARLNAMTVVEREKLLMGNMNHDQFDPTHPEHSMVSFPYSFPSAGHYRIWIQMKRNGKILNSAFDADVQ
ncbi:MAG TPA: hypothetical protein VK666_12280 [Chryseolinea sp.]|nr:hypothetical protein [Chryseolinea sp.]